MQEESASGNQGPVFSSNMDVNSTKNRGLLQATSNNVDNKTVRTEYYERKKAVRGKIEFICNVMFLL